MNYQLIRKLSQRRENLTRDQRIAILALRDYDLTIEAIANHLNFFLRINSMCLFSQKWFGPLETWPFVGIKWKSSWRARGIRSIVVWSAIFWSLLNYRRIHLLIRTAGKALSQESFDKEFTNDSSFALNLRYRRKIKEIDFYWVKDSTHDHHNTN